MLPINNVGVPYCSPRPRGCSVDGVVVLEVGHRPAGGGVPVTSALGLPVGACFQEFYGLLGFEEVMHHGW